MDLFIVEVEFNEGKNKGQVWKYCYLNFIQVIDLHESFSLSIIRDSNIYVEMCHENSKRITIEELIFKL